MLVGRDDADALHAAELAAAVGVGRIAGYLAGGMTSWREERLPVESIERLTVPELHERARRRADPRRARARRVGGRPHPGLALRAVPRHPRAARTGSTRRGRSPSSAPPASAPRSARSLVQRYGAPRGPARGRRRRRARGCARRLAGRALASTSWPSHACASPPVVRTAAAPGRGLRRGRALPPHVHDAAALVGRDAAARARALARGDELEPARARATTWSSPTSARSCTRCGGCRPRSGRRSVIVIGPGGRGVRARRHRPDRGLGGRRGARPPAPLVRLRARARWPCCWPRRRTSTTRSRRSSPTSSSGTSCTRCCAAADLPDEPEPLDVAERVGGSEEDWTRVREAWPDGLGGFVDEVREPQAEPAASGCSAARSPATRG